MRRLGLAALGAASILPSVAGATPTIDVGTHTLETDRAGQTVQIFVTGGDAVESLQFVVEIRDRTPDDGSPVPAITGVDLVSGTIFAGNNGGQLTDNGALPQIRFASIATASDTVAADGLLVTLTIDTTGVGEDTFDLLLTGAGADGSSAGDDTMFFGTLTTAITNGSLVVEEPQRGCGSGMVPAGMMMLLGMLWMPKMCRRGRSPWARRSSDG